MSVKWDSCFDCKDKFRGLFYLLFNSFWIQEKVPDPTRAGSTTLTFSINNIPGPGNSTFFRIHAEVGDWTDGLLSMGPQVGLRRGLTLDATVWMRRGQTVEASVWKRRGLTLEATVRMRPPTRWRETVLPDEDFSLRLVFYLFILLHTGCFYQHPGNEIVSFRFWWSC